MMKKTLVLILSIIIAFSSVTVMLDAFALTDGEKAALPSYIYRFGEDYPQPANENTQAQLSIVSNSSYGELSAEYNTGLQAVKISLLSSGSVINNGRLVFRPANSVKCTESSVFAVRIKLADPQIQAGVSWSMQPSTGDTYTRYFSPVYQKTTDWQTIVFKPDTSVFSGSEDWSIIRMFLFANSQSSGTVYLKWAGIFDSIADARKYADDLPLYTNFNSANIASAGVSFDNQQSNGAYTYSYDTATQSTKIKITEKNPSTHTARNTRVVLNLGNTVTNTNTFEQFVNCKDYPILAVRLKLSNASMDAGKTWTVDSTSGVQYVANPAYKETDEWQTLILDTSSTGWKADDNYKTVRMFLSDGASNFVNVGDEINIKWVAAFKTKSDVYAYTGDIEPVAPSPLFLEFTNKKVAANVVDSANKTQFVSNAKHGIMEVSYDKEEKATKLVYKKKGDGTDGAFGRNMRVEMGANTETLSLAAFNAKCSEYKYLAMRVKLSNPQTVAPVMAIGALSVYEGVTKEIGYTIEYNETDEWQTAIIDTSNIDWGENVWVRFNVFFASETSEFNNVNDTVHIKWFGAFKTTDEIYAYTGEEAPKEPEQISPLFFSFDKKNVSANVLDANERTQFISSAKHGIIDVSYDKEEKATKLVYKQKGDGTDGTFGRNMRLEIGGTSEKLSLTDKNVSCTEYPIVAVRVKLSNPYTTAPNIALGALGLSDKTIDRGYGVRFKRTTEWQTIVFDTNDGAWTNAVWQRFLLFFESETGKLNNIGDTVWIRWAGVFKTVQEAYAVTGETVPADEAAPSPIFARFDNIGIKEGAYDGFNKTKFASVERYGLMSAEYDMESDSTKLTYLQKGNGEEGKLGRNMRIEIGSGAEDKSFLSSNVSCNEYPILALRLKLTNPYMQAPVAAGSIVAKRPNEEKTIERAVGLDYRETTEWQTVIVDMNKYNDFYKDAVWCRFLLFLMSETGEDNKVGDSVLVKWFGVFKTVEDVYAYTGEEPPKEEYKPSPIFVRFNDRHVTLNEQNRKKLYNFVSNDRYGLMSAKFDPALQSVTMRYLKKGDGTEGKNGRNMRLEIGVSGDDTFSLLPFNASCTEYKVAAVRLKISNTLAVAPQLSCGALGVKPDGTTVDRAYYMEYAVTNGWQTILINMERDEARWESAIWKRFLLFFADENSITNNAGENGDTFTIKWFGVFRSKEEALAYDVDNSVSVVDSVKDKDDFDWNRLFGNPEPIVTSSKKPQKTIQIEPEPEEKKFNVAAIAVPVFCGAVAIGAVTLLIIKRKQAALLVRNIFKKK